MRDLTELLDAADLAVARGRGVLSDALVDDLERSARSLRHRRGFIGDTLVLAIAGGTGSGKSSLLNALAGSAIASVSPLRPHTDEPLAWIPEHAGPGLDRLLDELGITKRVRHDRFPGLAIVDLPDMDSIVDWHRRTVEELLPRVDAVMWIFDPEKYRDPALHEGFLTRLADYRDQFVFVLNKIDRLGGDDAAAVEAHLRTVLAVDGYPDAVVIPVAADPPDAGPLGMERLERFLRDRLDVKRVATGKLIADVRALLRTLGSEAGTWDGWAIGFEERWASVRSAAAAGLMPESGPAAREDALCRIEDFIAAVSVETGGTFGERLRSSLDPAVVTEGVEAAAETAPPEPGRRRRSRTRPDTGPVDAVLDDVFAQPMRAMLWQRARFAATVAYAAVGAMQLESKLGLRRPQVGGTSTNSDRAAGVISTESVGPSSSPSA